MSILEFLEACEALKRIPRIGWLLRGVHPTMAENVAEHSYSTTIIAYILARLSKHEINSSRLLLMALIHDLPESKLGDIPRSATKNSTDLKRVKQTVENQIITTLLANLPSKVRSPLRKAWQDFNLGTNAEARIVEAADRLATALHILSLVQSGHQVDRFISFFDHAEQTIAALQIPEANDIIKALREAFVSKSKSCISKPL